MVFGVMVKVGFELGFFLGLKFQLLKLRWHVFGLVKWYYGLYTPCLFTHLQWNAIQSVHLNSMHWGVRGVCKRGGIKMWVLMSNNNNISTSWSQVRLNLIISNSNSFNSHSLNLGRRHHSSPCNIFYDWWQNLKGCYFMTSWAWANEHKQMNKIEYFWKYSTHVNKIFRKNLWHGG
jgi:hypothetical protein